MSPSDADTAKPQPSSTNMPAEAPGARRDNALYQRDYPVAEVVGARIDGQAREIHFDELYKSDELLIPEDCEFREYRILIQSVGYASRQEAGAAHKGRVLKGVRAEILGYREQ